MAAMEVDSQTLRRKQSVYGSMDESFMIQKEMYKGQQYSQIYYIRLHLMRTLIYSILPNCKPHLLGIVVALHGKKTDAGNFLADDILEAGLPPQSQLPHKSGFAPYLETMAVSSVCP